MSVATPPPAKNALIDRLPRDKRDELVAIGRQALRRFGYAYQQVFDDHLQTFTFLIAQGATAAMIGKMLAEVGIVRKDGSVLPAGTISSALSRARERALQHRGKPLHGHAQTGMDAQIAASTGIAVRDPADHRNDIGPSPAGPRSSASLLLHQPCPEIQPSPNAPAGPLPAATRRAAALLEQLRSQNDDR